MHPQICLACCGGVDTLTRCDKPGHELPTIGPSCAACENEEQSRVRRAAEYGPQLAVLREIRAQHVRDFHKPWPGMEFGKALLGRSIDRAIADLEAKL